MFRKFSGLGLFFLLMMGANAYGTPEINSVSGDFRDGDSITITGSEFGNKAQAAPLLWDDFEWDNVDRKGDNEPVDADSNSTHSEDWTYRVGNIFHSADHHDDGRGLVSKHDMSGDCSQVDFYGRKANLYWVTDRNLKKVFVSFWVIFDWGIASPRHQIKLWRIAAGERPGGDKWLIFKDQHWGPESAGHYYQYSTGEGGPIGSIYYGHVQQVVENEWYRVEFQAEQSSPGIANGSIEVWHGGPGMPIVKVIDKQDFMTNTAGATSYWDHIAMGEYCSNMDCGIQCGAINYFDNVYLDNTWARIEIGDAATWSACTTRENQVATSWSPGSITITANTDAFPPGSAYLYVTDENGVKNENGFPINIEPSSTWLVNIVNSWQDNKITRNDLNKAIYWNLKGVAAIGDPMDSMTEEDIGNALKISTTE